MSHFRWTDTAREATAALARRPVRTLLTALGTILGAGAFIATTGLVETARAQVSARFDALAATEVRLRDAAPDGSDVFPPYPDAALEALNGVNHAGLYFSVPDDGSIRPRAFATSPALEPSQPMSVIAATPGAFLAQLPDLTAGQPYSSWHQIRAERVALLGRKAASQLGISGVRDKPVIFLGDTAFSVMGIFDEVARDPEFLFSVVIPTSTAAALFDLRQADRQILIDTDPGAADLVGHQAPIVLRPQAPERLLAVIPPDPSTLRNQVESDVQALFYAISGLAVLVGAVAITNATLLGVIERRAEIGLRRALGATRAHIMRQITIESALTGSLAGIVGTSLGLLVIVIAAASQQWTPTINPVTLPAGPLIGVVTGTIAGLIPAIRAARTPPAETLRT